MREKNYDNKGFSLVELIIVVAIMAILIGIIAPSFTHYIDKSKRATCATNCHSLKVDLSSSYAEGTLSDEDISKISLSPDNDYTYEGSNCTCPSGGTIYATSTNGAIEVRCTYHDDGQPNTGGTGTASWTNETMQNIVAAIKSKGVTKIDSTAVAGTDTAKNAALAALADAGIDLNALGATSWRVWVDNGKMVFEWTTADISTLSPGAKVPVIRYRPEGNFAGYSVWEEHVSLSQTKDYNVLQVGSKQYSATSSQQEKQDIDKMIAIYNQNCGTYPPLN
ncbi:MAG: prepilin-type N-terminal cleavage/methylation domain-containing protein [Clostridia bacterium]|nr:prepilin-type N-terminal cleavage/methylation domain-containing protein [Lachnospiraceae bacterium]NCC01495.1 prepilin-type N-terminal cleavage/methylation domain-containing protein [Clostridia bacterium]NCD03340.1 prepilin-type N-terminal cleavage/methylation domain-containing protein [Clostridia bacterium]